MPAIIELKKPRDNGPRKIVGFETAAFIQTNKEPELSMPPVKPPVTGAVPMMTFEALTNLES